MFINFQGFQALGLVQSNYSLAFLRKIVIYQDIPFCDVIIGGFVCGAKSNLNVKRKLFDNCIDDLPHLSGSIFDLAMACLGLRPLLCEQTRTAADFSSFGAVGLEHEPALDRRGPTPSSSAAEIENNAIRHLLKRVSQSLLLA